MGNKQKLIEINGRYYDALSGRLVKDPAVQPTPLNLQPTPKKGVIDGFMAPRRVRTQAKKPVTEATTVKKSVVSSAIHPAAASHTKVQRSKTLMRSAVKKPSRSKAVHGLSAATSLAHKNNLHDSESAILTAPSDKARAARAQNAKRHHAVKKFSHNAVSFMPVKTSAADTHPLAPTESQQPVSQPVQPSPIAPAMPSMVSSASHGVLDRMLDQALHDADSHKQTHHRKRRGLRIMPKWAAIGTSAAAVVLLAGFFAYQNLPNVAMRVAATRTGINASVPGYSPSGFAFSGPIGVSDGVITLRFNANADRERNFAIAQRSSDWDSKSLLENFVLANGYAYQTYQDKGNTIYIYDDNRATWVSKGIWYNIEGNALLNTDQLLKIASSM